MIAVVTTDGRRELLVDTVRSMLEHVEPIELVMVFDDSGDEDHATALAHVLPPLADDHPAQVKVFATGERRGYSAAMQVARSTAHRYAVGRGDRHVFWTEDDFLFTRPVPLDLLAAVVDHRHLAQMVLRRQPWFLKELAAGGVLERFGRRAELDLLELTAAVHDLHPETANGAGSSLVEWIEHRLFWTMNPHVLTVGELARPWPQGAGSEHRYWQRRRAAGPLNLRVGYWGRLDDEPWVLHRGDTRNGKGY